MNCRIGHENLQRPEISKGIFTEVCNVYGRKRSNIAGKLEHIKKIIEKEDMEINTELLIIKNQFIERSIEMTMTKIKQIKESNIWE